MTITNQHLRLTAAGLLASVVSLAGFTGLASASSISMTGPGSTNVISSGYGGGGGINNTGPGSKNYISSGNGHYNYGNGWYNKNKNHKNSYKKCEPRNWNNYKNDQNWRKQCFKPYNSKHWDSFNSYKTCYDRVKHDDKKHEDRNKHDYDHKNKYYKKDNNHGKYGGYGDDNKKYYHSNRGSSYKVSNDNDIDVDVSNNQRAYSGSAVVSGNTKGGSAYSGDASNRATSDVDVDITNSGGSGGFSGYSSWNSEYSFENDNDVDVGVDNNQYARSGDARVSGNTYGGNARSGDASNYSSSSVSVSIRN